MSYKPERYLDLLVVNVEDQLSKPGVAALAALSPDKLNNTIIEDGAGTIAAPAPLDLSASPGTLPGVFQQGTHLLGGRIPQSVIIGRGAYVNNNTNGSGLHGVGFKKALRPIPIQRIKRIYSVHHTPLFWPNSGTISTTGANTAPNVSNPLRVIPIPPPLFTTPTRRGWIDPRLELALAHQFYGTTGISYGTNVNPRYPAVCIVGTAPNAINPLNGVNGVIPLNNAPGTAQTRGIPLNPIGATIPANTEYTIFINIPSWSSHDGQFTHHHHNGVPFTVKTPAVIPAGYSTYDILVQLAAMIKNNKDVMQFIMDPVVIPDRATATTDNPIPINNQLQIVGRSPLYNVSVYLDKGFIAGGHQPTVVNIPAAIGPEGEAIEVAKLEQEYQNIGRDLYKNGPWQVGDPVWRHYTKFANPSPSEVFLGTRNSFVDCVYPTAYRLHYIEYDVDGWMGTDQRTQIKSQLACIAVETQEQLNGTDPTLLNPTPTGNVYGGPYGNPSIVDVVDAAYDTNALAPTLSGTLYSGMTYPANGAGNVLVNNTPTYAAMVNPISPDWYNTGSYVAGNSLRPEISVNTSGSIYDPANLPAVVNDEPVLTAFYRLVNQVKPSAAADTMPW
jgi:hypothetical protein